MPAARRSLALTVASATVLALTAAPAAAFHHVALPAASCGASDFAGGANPVAVTALRDHNPAQDLPLPPISPEEDTRAEAALASAVERTGCGR